MAGSHLIRKIMAFAWDFLGGFDDRRLLEKIQDDRQEKLHE